MIVYHRLQTRRKRTVHLGAGDIVEDLWVCDEYEEIHDERPVSDAVHRAGGLRKLAIVTGAAVGTAVVFWEHVFGFIDAIRAFLQ